MTYEAAHSDCGHLFRCGIGNMSFTVGYDGIFRLCPSLVHPDCVYNLKKGSLHEAWNNFVPIVKEMKSDNIDFLTKCKVCPIINLCMYCPANAHLEIGQLDGWVDYFCKVAKDRERMLK